MNIETKFDPEDEAFTIHKEEIVKVKISRVRIDLSFDENKIEYITKLKGRKTPILIDESELHQNIDGIFERMKSKFIENSDS